MEERGRALWLPVDPTLNQFPADATHLRLARGGLDRQAVVMPLIGRLKMTDLDVELAPGSVPVIVGGPGPRRRRWPGLGFPAAPVRRDCWSDSWIGP